MPPAAFFTRLGLFVRPGFLDAGTCEELLREARAAASQPALVGYQAPAVDESTRRTRVVEISSDTLSRLAERLLALMPELERHFGVTLSGCQCPQLLAYGPGAFFVPHRDHAPDGAPEVRERKVSVVVFLNGQSRDGAAGTYSGGALTFYGLLDDPRAASTGFPMAGEPGLLVAFRSDVCHGVSPVTDGERYSLVNWYF